MNNVVISGRVARDPFINTSAKGRLYCRFRFAIYGDYRGSQREREVDFVWCYVYGRKTEYYSQKLRKGYRLIITGKLKTFESVDDFGNRRERNAVIAQKIELLDAHEVREPIEDIRGSDGKLILPKELTESVLKRVDGTDEDIPEEFTERSMDDLL